MCARAVENLMLSFLTLLYFQHKFSSWQRKLRDSAFKKYDNDNSLREQYILYCVIKRIQNSLCANVAFRITALPFGCIPRNKTRDPSFGKHGTFD